MMASRRIVDVAEGALARPTSEKGTADTTDRPPVALGRHRWLILAVLVAAQFIVVLDAAVVNIALPSIQHALDFSDTGLAWVINGYILTFGGFLLFGGRVADLFGRKRMFLAGLGLFVVASLACGVAVNSGELVVFRAVQGLGAALLSPAALSILTTTFTDRTERHAALGVWGAIGGVAATFGVLAGGVLTAGAGWAWVFLINVPIGAALMAAAVVLRPDPRDRLRPQLDLLGAVLVTSSVCAFVYAVFRSTSVGWVAASTLGTLLGAVALGAVFVGWERRSSHPLVPAAVFRRHIVGANLINLLVGAVLFSTLFFLTLYLQRVLGYGPLLTGLAQLPLATTQLLIAAIAGRLTTRIGYRSVLVAGLLGVAGSLTWLAQARAQSHYVHGVLGPSILFGAGFSFALVALFIAGQAEVSGPLAGLASGLITTSFNVGGAVGLAVLGALAATHTAALAHTSTGANVTPWALTAGFDRGWAIAAICALAGVVLAVTVLPSRGDRIDTERPR